MADRESAEAVALRVAAELQAQTAIDYSDDLTDKEYPEITWFQYGLSATNEIAVVARVGREQLGQAEPSTLLIPSMADRIWGMDVDDQRLALWISEQIWKQHSGRLISEALRVRKSSSDNTEPTADLPG